MIELEPCLTIKEVAAYLGIHPFTATRMAREGKLPGRKVGKSWKFDPDQIRDYMCGGEVPPEQEPENKLWPLDATQKLASTTVTGISTKSAYAKLLGQK